MPLDNLRRKVLETESSGKSRSYNGEIWTESVCHWASVELERENQVGRSPDTVHMKFYCQHRAMPYKIIQYANIQACNLWSRRDYFYVFGLATVCIDKKWEPINVTTPSPSACWQTVSQLPKMERMAGGQEINPPYVRCHFEASETFQKIMFLMTCLVPLAFWIGNPVGL